MPANSTIPFPRSSTEAPSTPVTDLNAVSNAQPENPKRVRHAGYGQDGEPLTTIDGETADSVEARVILSGTVRSAKVLLAHLEKHWEFGVDEAWPKEHTCPD
jgi:hypothetical protein